MAVIRYRRPGAEPRTFRQAVVHRSPSAIITLLERVERDAPLVLDDQPVLEPGAAIVWLTLPGACRDVGRFHTRAGAFTGFYTNVLTAPEFSAPLAWSTTDLFLDVWQPRNGPPRLLDEDQLEAALGAGLVTAPQAAAARAEAAAVLREADSGAWPPPLFRDWTLERARAALSAP